MEIERQTYGAATTHQRSGDVAFTETRHPGSWSASELLASILDGVADGIAAHDASGQLLFINDAGARMCGYEGAAEALAAPAGDFLRRVEALDDGGSALSEAEPAGPLGTLRRVVPDRDVLLPPRLGSGVPRLSVQTPP